MLKVKDPSLAATMHALVTDPELGGIALRGLSGYDDPATPDVLIEAYAVARTNRAPRRPEYAGRAPKRSARALLAAVEAGKLPRGDLTADLVRQIRNVKDAELDIQLGQVWGTVRETTGDRARVIAQYKALLTSRPSQPADRSLGRAVFTKVCQQCHTLFGVGGQVGPDLTGSNRADLDYVLSNVLDSSALIGKDYLAHVIATTDGRVLTGIIRAEDKDTITLVTANETLVATQERGRRAQGERAIDDAGRPLEAALRARNPVVGLLSRQPGAGPVAGYRT